MDRRPIPLGSALLVVLAYMVAEFIGGLVTDSLALMADAGHMLSDAAALGLSLVAMRVTRRPATSQKTYGYYRAEILAALVNGASLIAIAIYILLGAFGRFRNPPPVMGGTMMVIAIGGLLVNAAVAWILHGSRAESLNVRGAWLHVLADTAGSLGAIVAGLLIWTLGWNLADPIASVLIGLLIVLASWRLLQEAVAILMEAAPDRVGVDAIRERIMAVPGVLDVHHLHVWTITSGMESLSAHVVAAEYSSSRLLLQEIRKAVHHDFGIDHLTIQVEPRQFDEIETPV